MIFTVRITQSVSTPHCEPRYGETPALQDPIIVTLTYFRHETVGPTHTGPAPLRCR